MQANLGLMFERKAKVSCNGARGVTKKLRATQDCKRTSRKTDFRQKNETSAGLKITFVDMTYPGQRPELPSLSRHFLLSNVYSFYILVSRYQGRVVNEDSLLSTYNTTMHLVAEKSNAEHTPLAFQLDVPWESASSEAKSQCVEKASEDCLLVCNMVAPESGAQLYEALASQRGMEPSSDLEALMMAYRNAKTSGLRTQILSIYAFKYPIPVLMKLHEPYEKLTRYQVKRARKHAKLYGPGTIPENEPKHRTRLDMGKVDHFLEFANRPYFYQDVAYGSRILKLDSGEKIPMPNVVRTVTRSTMVKQYQSFCEEESFNPWSRSTLFKILDVREASQRR